VIARDLLLLTAAAALASGQEAQFGATFPVVISGQVMSTDRAGAEHSPSAAYRMIVSPTVKLGANWFGYSAIQVHRSPYFFEEAYEKTRETRVDVLQAYIGYTRSARDRTLTVKAGQLTSAFGAFPLRYDDSRNALIDMPFGYGAYGGPISVYGIPGVEVNAVIGRADARAQFTNSSPISPRKLWDHDQYGSFTAGGGYAIAPGLRAGVSAFRGAYLYRGHEFYFPGEARPKDLPATGYGVDVQAARGRWNVSGEVQRIQLPYRAIPYFFLTSAYGEAKFTLSPRWYVAGRSGAQWRTAGLGRYDRYEAVVGFRPASRHLVKAGYEWLQGRWVRGARDNVLAVQYVVQVHPPTWAIR